MQTERIRDVGSSTSIFDIGVFNIVPNLITTPVYTTFEYLGITYYFLSNPKFLIELKSRQTNTIKRLNPDAPSGINAGTGINRAEHWISFRINYTITGTEDITNHIITVGNDDFPLGYYQLKIYEMESDGDYDPANALQTLVNCYMLFYPNEVDDTYNFQAVKYKEYSNNDADTNSVYITN